MIHTVVDWFVLGVKLKLPIPKLKEIEKNNLSTPEDCLADMIALWLNLNVRANWQMLVDALIEAGMKDEAAYIVKKLSKCTIKCHNDYINRIFIYVCICIYL